MPTGEQVFDLFPIFNVVEFRMANHIVKSCRMPILKRGMPFSFAEREDFSFEDERYYVT